MDDDEPMETAEDQSNTQASDGKCDPTSNENVVEGTDGDTEDAKKLSPENTDVDTKQNEGTTDNADASVTETKTSAEAEESAAM